ncbi:MAG: hypothetical protein GXO89_04345 [Chlorobi bacterium]|nr:hypothetical protein [Chlorobiota bacterium]
MKKPILYLLFTLIALVQIISLSSCGKKEYFPLSDEFKSFAVFPVGSYWVYEEINSGFVDTMTVKEVSIEYEVRAESNRYYEQGYIHYRTRKSGLIIGSISNTSPNSNCGYLNSLLLRNSTDTLHSEFLDVDNEFFCCCEPGSKSWFNPMFKYSGVIDTVTAGGYKFQNARAFSNTIEDTAYLEQFPGTVKISYFAKNVGLIKWEQFNGNVWELKEFKIN